jgi:hypothetical protein
LDLDRAPSASTTLPNKARSPSPVVRAIRAAVLLDLGLDELGVMGVQLSEGALIVGAELAIAGDIGHQNGH